MSIIDFYNENNYCATSIYIFINYQDPEEEEDTESGDREGEVRAERIARIQVKLEKYKKLLQEEESSLQEAQNVYVSGMEESISDKEQQK